MGWEGRGVVGWKDDGNPQNKMKQIDTSRYFWRAAFGRGNKNHYSGI